MKKIGLLALLLGFGVMVFGIVAKLGVNTISAQTYQIPQNANELALTNSYSNYGSCHRNRVDYTSYEWLYAHLSEADQDLVDIQYLELILAIDFDNLTDEERLEAIDNVKDELVTFIEESEFEIGSWR